MASECGRKEIWRDSDNIVFDILRCRIAYRVGVHSIYGLERNTLCVVLLRTLQDLGEKEILLFSVDGSYKIVILISRRLELTHV